MTEHDTVLLDRWRRDRDAQAFREIFERHAAMVHATARRIVGSPDRAEDVTQECFLKLAQVPAASPRSLAAWLHRVATNAAISVLRAERRRRRLETRAVRAPRESGEAAWEEIEAKVDEALARLPDRERVPLVEHFLCGRTHEAIARELGVSRETVGYRVRRGLERVRSDLRRRGVRAGSATLAAGLGTLERSSAGAVSATLRASLAKIALAGVSAPPAVASAGGIALGAKIAAAVAIAATLVVGAFWATRAIDALRGPDSVVEIAAPAAGESAEAASGDGSRVPARAGDASGAGTRSNGAPAVVADATVDPPLEDPAGEPPETATVSGRVVDALGVAVPGVDVLLALPRPGDDGSDPRSRFSFHDDDWDAARILATVTGGDGDFRFDEVPAAGSARLSVLRRDRYAAPAFVELAQPAEGDGVTITLEEGRTVEGRVFGAGGRPVSDAVVSIHHAYNDDGHAGGGNFVVTDPAGRFAVSVGAGATALTIRVSSPTEGQEFFTAVEVGDVPLRLEYRPPAVLEGVARWTDGSPAAGLLVCASGEVPEAPPLQRYSGWRRRLEACAEVAPDGTYEVSDLLPGIVYDLAVFAPAREEEPPVARTPLTPRFENRRTFAAGEVARWDPNVPRRIVVRGRVTTASTRTSVSGIDIAVRKDGKDLHTASSRTNAEGVYELPLTTGPGAYRICASPERSFGPITELLAESFGKTVVLAEGDDLELDLELFEPIRLPVRVLDARGQPVQSVQTDLSVQLPDGKRFGFGSSYRLDEDGRRVFEIFHPVKDFALEVSAFPSGPAVESERWSAVSGATLPEWTVTLPATCAFSGTAVDAAGEPLAKAALDIRARFKDGGTDSVAATTNDAGDFSVEGRLRAASVRLEIRRRGAGKEPSWTSEVLAPAPGETLSLGRIVLAE